jgi:hypothetical protein
MASTPLKQVYYGSASVSVSGNTTTLPPVSVTASGSGTATSIISQLDADNLARKVAKNVANAALQNDINVINQTTKIVYVPPLVPYYRQLEIDVIVDEMKAQNDANGYPNNFIYSNTLLDTYRNTPYLELQYPDSTGTNLTIYSTTYFETVTYLFSNLGTDLVLDSTNVIINGSRIYVWDETIVNNIQVGTDEFPMEKTYQFQPQYQTPQNTTTQIMKKVASVPLGAAIPYYNTTMVLRETIYIYYASTTIFLLIDSNDTTNSTTNMPYTSKPKIYAMQTMSNLYFTDININNLYLLKNQLQLPAGTQPPDSTNYNYIPLPAGFNFVVYTIPYNYCVYSVSTLNENAILISDGCDNSYQYIDPKYNQFLYDQFNI